MSEEDLGRERINQWFNKNYSMLLREVKNNIAKGGMSGYAVELLHITTIQFLTKPIPQQLQMLDDNKIKNYILRSAGLNLRSSTSPFYHQIRKFKMSTRSGALPDMLYEREYIENTDLWRCFQENFNSMNFYYRELITQKYLNKLTFEDLHKKYGISKASLGSDINKGLRYLRSKCSHCDTIQNEF